MASYIIKDIYFARYVNAGARVTSSCRAWGKVERGGHVEFFRVAAARRLQIALRLALEMVGEAAPEMRRRVRPRVRSHPPVGPLQDRSPDTRTRSRCVRNPSPIRR